MAIPSTAKTESPGNIGEEFEVLLIYDGLETDYGVICPAWPG